jgi:hypothetical protein
MTKEERQNVGHRECILLINIIKTAPGIRLDSGIDYGFRMEGFIKLLELKEFTY